MSLEMNAYQYLDVSRNLTISTAHKLYIQAILRNVMVNEGTDGIVISPNEFHMRVRRFAPQSLNDDDVKFSYERLWDSKYKKNLSTSILHYLYSLQHGIENSWNMFNCLEIALIFSLATQLQHGKSIQAAVFAYPEHRLTSYGAVWKMSEEFGGKIGIGINGRTSSFRPDQFNTALHHFTGAAFAKQVAESKSWL